MDDQEKLVLAWVESQSMDQTADYLARGRAFKTLSKDELSAVWIAAFKDMANEPQNDAVRRLHNDLDAEWRARSETPPYAEVPDLFDIYRAKVNCVLERLQKDGEASDELDAAFEAEIERFVSLLGNKGN